MSRRRTFIVLAVVCCAVPTLALARGSQTRAPQLLRAGRAVSRKEQAPSAGLIRRDASLARLDSRLVAAVRPATGVTADGLARGIRSVGVQSVGDRLRVVIEARNAARARAAIVAAGGTVEASFASLIEALVPRTALPALSRSSAVKYVRAPLSPDAEAVGGEEVAASHADLWQSAHFTGLGVKVGIIDLGFAGYTDRQAQGDLPANVVTQDFCGGNFTVTTNHGAAVAEIVHEMAPDAQLYLICVNNEVSLAQAEAYAKSQGILIVNHSVGWFNSGRGDGSGPIGAVVTDARANGILWVNSAGNYAQTHWSGTFVDTDGDPYLNYTPSDEGNSFTLGSGSATCGYLKWDEFPVAQSDFDLILANSATGQVVAASANQQTGTQPPTESVCVQNTGPTGQFFWAIYAFRRVTNPRLDFFMTGGALEYQTPAGSIADPASSTSALAVGALCWQNEALEFYSSQGPTIDGRVKPDVAGQDSVSGGTYGTFSSCPSGFAGTSAASPEVAGAAALIKQENPAFGPNELQAFIERSVIDLGAAGKDNQYGSGQLSLPAPAPVVTDTTPPKAKALASSGKHGKTIRLLSTASDDSGVVKVTDQVIKGTRVLATGTSAFTRATSFSFAWHAPATFKGTIKHCVKAVDKAGNASPQSCAALTVK
jgi:subtilisin family serine protease